MVSRKQFYTVFSIFIIIFITAVLIFNSKDEEVTGNNLVYKNNIIYTFTETKTHRGSTRQRYENKRERFIKTIGDR